jgi:hypothetical protein
MSDKVHLFVLRMLAFRIHTLFSRTDTTGSGNDS